MSIERIMRDLCEDMMNDSLADKVEDLRQDLRGEMEADIEQVVEYHYQRRLKDDLSVVDDRIEELEAELGYLRREISAMDKKFPISRTDAF